MGDQLRDDDHVARYCKPSAMGGDGLPTAHAFLPREAEDLSVNWLEYFTESTRVRAVDRVRCALLNKSYTLKRNGRLAVLKVHAVRDAARRVSCALRVDHQPEENDPSHAGIGGWEGADDTMVVALALKRLVLDDHLHPAAM